MVVPRGRILTGDRVSHTKGAAMPKASKATATESVSVEGYEGHFENVDGGYTVGFETYTADADLAPLFKGLPDDRCHPSEELAATMAVVEKNMEATG